MSRRHLARGIRGRAAAVATSLLLVVLGQDGSSFGSTARQDGSSFRSTARQDGSSFRSTARQDGSSFRSTLGGAQGADVQAAAAPAGGLELDAVGQAQARAEAEIEADRIRLEQLREQYAAWKRTIDERVAAARAGALGSAACDDAHAETADALRQARARLRDALDTLRSPRRAPRPPATVDSELLARREALDQVAVALDARRRDLGWAAADTWRHAVADASRDRDVLLTCLSAARRTELFGFGPRGLLDVGGELDQVTLVARWRMAVGRRWFGDVPRRLRDPFLQWELLTAALKILITFGLWRAWRRRTDELLVTPVAPVATFAASSADRIETARILLRRIRGPIEGLLALWGLYALLGDASHLVELQILATVVVWILSAKIAVAAIDAVAGVDRTSALAVAALGSDEGVLIEEPDATEPSPPSVVAPDLERPALARPGPQRVDASELRLRSLRFTARWTVAAGLLLALTSLVAGRGVAYDWMASLCAAAAVPVGLVLLRWWRPIVLERTSQRQAASGKPSRALDWVHRDASRWYGLLVVGVGAAVLGAIHLSRRVRHRLASLETTRRVLAYLFRRQVARTAEASRDATPATPLPEGRAAQLEPEARSRRTITTIEKPFLDECIANARANGGGIVAVVAERGGGKSTLLRRMTRLLAPSIGDAILLHTFQYGEDGKVAPHGLTAESVAERGLRAVLLDDVHRIVRPAVGGLERLDTLMAVARQSSATCTWVFAVDAASWQFLRRARGHEPMFDRVVHLRPWAEESVARLLRTRSASSALRPKFDALLAEVDPSERPEELLRVELGYYRLLWDYAAGNPAVALHFWRRSLWQTESGWVEVRLFQAPDVDQLERLPDSARFVLRALLQLDGATVETLVEVTQLPAREVHDAIRFAAAAGYLDPGPRWRISWTWYRAVTRFLKRKHLLV